MLRRVKTEIEELNLPERIVKVEECEFEESEEFVYNQLRTVAESKMDQIGEKNDMISALVLLLRLRQGQWYGLARVTVC
jgi:SNF2 family DNA or RNA helicase